MYDVAIVGSGVAGLSAALTLKALNKNFIWFGSKEFSAKIRSAELIRNYPGLPMVSGSEMKEIFSSQIKGMDIEITDKQVTGVYSLGEKFGVLCGKESFEARAVIIATGVEAVKPIKGELEYLGRGVSYCAVCDGFLYKDKTIAVVCTSEALEEEIDYLADLAKKIYLVPIYKDVGINKENVEIVSGMPVEVSGGKKAERLIFRDKQLSVDGIFMLKSAIAPSVLVAGIETDGGHIKVGRDMSTNLKGCFAAGDCTGRPYQYAKAAGEGNIAAHSANSYLSALKEL